VEVVVHMWVIKCESLCGGSVCIHGSLSEGFMVWR